MTAPDRSLLAVLKGETRRPAPAWFMRQAGRYLPEYRAVREQAGGFLAMCLNAPLAAEVTLQPIRRYGFDGAILFSDILIVPWMLEQKVWFAAGEGPQLTPIRDLAGLSALNRVGALERAAAVYEAASLVRRSLPSTTTLLGFAGAPWTVASYMVEGAGSKDYQAAKSWLYRDPAGFQALIDLLVDATFDHLVAQIDAGCDAVQIFDSWAGALSEPEFRRWCVAPVKALVERLRAARPGVPVICFPRGAGLMLEAYCEAVQPDCVGLDSATPAAFAAARLQSRWTVQGNLDPIALLAGGAAMEAEILRLKRIFGGGRWVFNLGHGVVPATPPEHVAQALEILRRPE